MINVGFKSRILSFYLSKKIILLLLFLILNGSVFSQTTIFPFNSSWKYKDDGSDQGTVWSQTGFDDSSWLSGAARLGYGKPGMATILNACGVPVQNPTCMNKYIGYYFRKTVNIADVSLYKSFKFEMYRDDGVVIHVNGVEVFRNNMPDGVINYNTLANMNAPDDGLSIISVTIPLAASQLQSGTNTIAVGVHQSAPSSSDLVWDMKLTGIPPGLILLTRGPYLQKATPTSMLVRWYTDDAVDSKVTFGTDPGNLSQSVVVTGSRTSHAVQLTGLTPYTKYYYSIGTNTEILQSGVQNYFLTSPLPNAEGKYTFWAIGDMGDNSTRQRAVRDRFNSYMGTNMTNGWILLGDNAYDFGTEDEYTSKFFEIYQDNIMRKSPLWPTTGNNDYASSTARQKDQNIPYFDFFDLPVNGEAGGVSSGSEAYYSFDYGNIHFVSLDSYIIESNTFRLFDLAGPQVQWLQQDLAANNKKWTIVYLHHPPYTMGSHNSDTEDELVKIRENIAPILEQYDVDLVLSGHSHSYERSKLMKGHFGLESTFDPALHQISQSSGKYDGTPNSCTYIKDSPASLGGTVYAVVGSSGILDPGQINFPHDAMYYGNDTRAGSLILEIEANRLDGKWLNDQGNILDRFTIMKNVNKVNNLTLNAGDNVTLTASWVGQYNWSSGQTSRSININAPSSSVTYTVADPNLCVSDTYNISINRTISIPSVGFSEICAGSAVSISYNATGDFTAGNTFTLQLSNASGSFSSPVIIGSLSGIGSGTINSTIPDNTPIGNNYRFRIVSSNPVFTGSNSSSFIVNSVPVAPSVGTITQPTCTLSTGSVVLSNLPSSGTWTLTRNPGGITTTGTGTNATISLLAAGTYNYTVTSTNGCISPASSNVVINTQPLTPAAPIVGTITQPTCIVSTGSVVLSNLPSSGTWTLTRSPGGATTTGTGTSALISLIPSGTYTYTVTNSAGCVSPATSNVVIDVQPVTPVAPAAGTITQPSCTVSTGSVLLSNLPSSGTWTLTRSPGGATTTGTGTSTTISLLVAGTYTYSVTGSSGCASPSSSGIVINTQPVTPAAPNVGTITQTTCTVSTGSVVLNNLPSSGTWTLTRTPGGTTTGTGTSTTISLLAAGTYTYTVTSSFGCISPSSTSIVINTQPVTPAAPAVGTITQPSCTVSTGSVVLSNLPSSGTWTLTRTPGGATSTGSGTSTTLSGLTAGTFTYKVTNASGCVSVSSTNVIINAQPVTPVAPIVSDVAYCRNATASALTATALSGHTLLWYGTNETGGTGGTTPPVPSTSTAGTTNFYVSQRNTATTCESVRARIIVTINAVPKPVITATGMGTGNVQLGSSASSGNQWFKDGSAIAGATSQTYSVPDDGVYQVSATAQGCVSDLSDPFTALVTDVKDSKYPIRLSLFPVPAREALTIQLTGVKDNEITEMMVIDMAGRVISKQKIIGAERTLVIEDYPSGNYFLVITNNSFLLNGRFIKN